MGLYRRFIFPWLMDHALGGQPMSEQRRIVLSRARGEVLEIGFGTGLNLPHYPDHVKRLHVVEPNAGMGRTARKRIAASPISVTPHSLSAERLPFPDASFDTIVCTWTLCSIPDVAAALRESHRILKPGGEFLFIEHGLSPELQIARLQHRLNPLQRIVADGCNLNRDMRAILSSSPLELLQCDMFYLDQTPRLFGFTYRGLARRP